MNIETFCNQLNEKLASHLHGVDVTAVELTTVSNSAMLIRNALQELREFVTTYKFQTEAEEITFFKHTKPALLSAYFFYKQIFTLRVMESFSSPEVLKNRYNRQLRKLAAYVEKNSRLYSYWMANGTESDTLYFTRGHTTDRAINRDRIFSTGYDIRMSRILAGERIRKYIRSACGDIPQTTSTPLTWTESKVALTELVYALHASEVFNQGNVDIKVIAATFETLFKIDLGNYYRVFLDLKIRKNSRTIFLDKLRTTLERRISELD